MFLKVSTRKTTLFWQEKSWAATIFTKITNLDWSLVYSFFKFSAQFLLVAIFYRDIIYNLRYDILELYNLLVQVPLVLSKTKLDI